jgi:hypothetical protein
MTIHVSLTLLSLMAVLGMALSPPEKQGTLPALKELHHSS